jgi:membrane protein DedA with SNARE-associated domain
MIGATPPLPQYAFMAWCSVESTVTHLPLHHILLCAFAGVT